MADSPGSPPDPPDRPQGSRRGRQPLPARLFGSGARGVRRVAQATGLEGTAEAVAEEAIVRAIESEAAERALARVLQGPAVEEAVENALTSPAIERALTQAVDSEMIDRIWERLLASDEAQRLVERIAEAPEVRSAVAAQGVGLLGDIGRQVARTAHRLDHSLERVMRRLVRRPQREGKTDRAGAVSRALALALDAAILNFFFLAVSGVVGLLASLFLGEQDTTSESALAIGAGIWLISGSTYLVSFWALAGQTPGMHFLRIRLDAEGTRRIGLRCAVRRLFGLAASIIPFGIGLLGVLFSDRRRGWQDRIAGTEVLYVDTSAPAAPWSDPRGAVAAADAS
ncbi:MAG: RDD family protein [Actinomycetota bacterium]